VRRSLGETSGPARRSGAGPKQAPTLNVANIIRTRRGLHRSQAPAQYAREFVDGMSVCGVPSIHSETNESLIYPHDGRSEAELLAAHRRRVDTLADTDMYKTLQVGLKTFGRALAAHCAEAHRRDCDVCVGGYIRELGPTPPHRHVRSVRAHAPPTAVMRLRVLRAPRPSAVWCDAKTTGTATFDITCRFDLPTSSPPAFCRLQPPCPSRSFS
jgi:hypothetical protein